MRERKKREKNDTRKKKDIQGGIYRWRVKYDRMKAASYKLHLLTTIELFLPDEPKSRELWKQELVDPHPSRGESKSPKCVGWHEVNGHSRLGSFPIYKGRCPRVIIMSNVLQKGGAAVIFTRRCLLGLESYWGNPPPL